MNADAYPPFKLRLPAEVMGWIREEAARNYRSINAEISQRLDQARRATEQNASPASGGAQTAGMASQA
jgi:hypothetical protein